MQRHILRRLRFGRREVSVVEVSLSLRANLTASPFVLLTPPTPSSLQLAHHGRCHRDKVVRCPSGEHNVDPGARVRLYLHPRPRSVLIYVFLFL